jgi:hypothetical protein
MSGGRPSYATHCENQYLAFLYTLLHYPTSSTWKSSYLPPPFATGFTCAPVLNGSGHLCWSESSNTGISWDGWLRFTFWSPVGGFLNPAGLPNFKFGFHLLSAIALTSSMLPGLFQLIQQTYSPPSFTKLPCLRLIPTVLCSILFAGCVSKESYTDQYLQF